MGERVPLKSLPLRSPNLERNCGARAGPSVIGLTVVLGEWVRMMFVSTQHYIMTGTAGKS